MNRLYEVAKDIMLLPPLNYYEWKQWHQWPNQVIADHIAHEQTIVDVGAGCGFLSMHLLMLDKCDRVIAYDTRELMCEFMTELSNSLGLSDRFEARFESYQIGTPADLTVSTRLGFSNLLLANISKTMTLARTRECEPIFKYVETPSGFKEKIVTRDDGFTLRLLCNYQD
jgi:16S rRNA G527 N7-methylase RsmG